MYHCPHKLPFRGACFRILSPSLLSGTLDGFSSSIPVRSWFQFSVGGRVLVGSACLFGNLIFVKHAISHCRPCSVLICSPENVLQQIFFSKFLCSSAAQRDSSPILTCHYWIPPWWSICNMTQSDLLPRGLFGPWETHTSCQKVRVEPAFSFALHFNYSNSPLSFTQEPRNAKQM